MNTQNYLSKTAIYLRGLRSKRKEIAQPSNELVHPRFGINQTTLDKKKASDSLMILMYSKENDTLFI